MFFDDLKQIQVLAKQRGTAIFVLPDQEEISIKGSIVLKPEDKTVITIEQVREALSHLNLKQTKDQFIVFRPADKMQNETANAILKNLEEPKDKIHYILITNHLTKLLPTIISRSAIYFWRPASKLNLDIKESEEIKNIAKRLLIAKDRDLITVANEITKKKSGVKDCALEVLTTSIEMLYKSFLITNKTTFLNKIPKFLTAYENIAANGNIKLHLVADLC